jgi:hypothetical protein
MKEEKLNQAKLFARLRDYHREIADVIDAYLKTLVPETTLAQPTWKEVVPLKSTTDRLLGTLYIADNLIRIVPSGNLKSSTPPFQSFLISRVLEAMIKKDKETGIVPPLSFEVKEESDKSIKEILIWNCGDPNRVKEIKTSVRWTFEKMAEKLQ